MRVTYVLYHSKDGSTTASFNRVSLLNRGLLRNGVDSRMMILRVSCSKSLTIRRITAIISILRIIILLAFARKGDCVILYGEIGRLDFIRRFKSKGGKLLVERNEYSSYQINDRMSKRQEEASHKYERTLQYVDGFITCSHFLEMYYRQFTNPNCEFCLIPLVVDQSKFETVGYTSDKYIAYCGDFGGNKDGLPTLLNAYAKFRVKFPDQRLYLIGSTSQPGVMEQLEKQIIELEISNEVHFTGRVPHDSMPGLLGAASLLVLARPANKQAEGGIPSKLAEYLSTSRPTLVTQVGELDRYFTDKKALFFAKPDSVEDFANKMIEIFSSYDFAQSVAKNGAKSVAQFDYVMQAGILNDFLIKLCNK